MTALDVCSELAKGQPIPSKLRKRYADVLDKFAEKLRREGMPTVAPKATILANELRNRNLSQTFDEHLKTVHVAALSLYTHNIVREL